MSDYVRRVEAALTDDWRTTAEICDSVPPGRVDRRSAVRRVLRIMSRLEADGIAEKRIVAKPGRARVAEWKRKTVRRPRDELAERMRRIVEANPGIGRYELRDALGIRRGMGRIADFVDLYRTGIREGWLTVDEDGGTRIGTPPPRPVLPAPEPREETRPEPEPEPPDFSALLAVLRDHGPLTRRELAVLYNIPFKDSERAMREGAVAVVPKPRGASVIVPVEEASRCRCRSARDCRDARRRHGRH